MEERFSGLSVVSMLLYGIAWVLVVGFAIGMALGIPQSALTGVNAFVPALMCLFSAFTFAVMGGLLKIAIAIEANMRAQLQPQPKPVDESKHQETGLAIPA